MIYIFSFSMSLTQDQAVSSCEGLLAFHSEHGPIKTYKKITITENRGVDTDGNLLTVSEDRAEEVVYIVTKTINTMTEEQVDFGLSDKPNDAALLAMKEVFSA